MPDQYFYNSQGEFIAFRIGKYIFDSHNNWVGWLPWKDREIVDKMGDYIATIHGDRLYVFSRRECKNHPGFIKFPGHPGYIEDPGFGGSTSIPPFAKELKLI